MKQKATKKLGPAIRKFTKPLKSEWHLMDYSDSGEVMVCRDWWCQAEVKLPSKRELKHGKNCSLSLLKKHGDTKKLREILADRARNLDYEGGGHNSCPICKGGTGFRGLTPNHERNCPGKVAMGRTKHQ